MSLDLICLSDTHELHRDVRVAEADMLVFCGDITFFSQRPSVLRDFNAWLGELPHRYKIVVPGNHDTLLESGEHRKTITNAHLLINQGIELGGLRIWGSPVTPYANAAFGIGTATARKAHWAKMPHGIDVLVTHGPPHKILDRPEGSDFHAGDPELRSVVAERRPRVHCFGHVHGAYGTYPTLHTFFVNSALMGELGDLDKSPVRLRLTQMMKV